MADQNDLKSKYRLARVVSVNTDKKGVVRDVKVKCQMFPSYPVSSVNQEIKWGRCQVQSQCQISHASQSVMLSPKSCGAGVHNTSIAIYRSIAKVVFVDRVTLKKLTAAYHPSLLLIYIKGSQSDEI